MDDLKWFKSTFSAQNGGCVEVAFKSSTFSEQVNCVEVSRPVANQVLVRDTKDRTKAPHSYTDQEWRAFIDGAKAGEFDLPA
jgi:hypothetical protein